MKYLRLIIFILIVIFPAYVYALEYPKLHYRNAVVYNLSEKETMYSLGESDRASVASLTKILTVMTSLDFIDTNYSSKLVLPKDSYIKTLDVLDSTIKSYDIKIANDIYAYLPNDYNSNDLNIEYIGKNAISFKDEKSSKLGDINIYYKNKIIYTESVYLEMYIKKDLRKFYVCFILIMIFIMLCTISILKLKRKQYQ